MKKIDGWLKKCTYSGLMQLFGLCIVLLSASAWLIPIPDIVFAIHIFLFILLWRCRKEASRRDDLLGSSGPVMVLLKGKME